MGNSGDLPTFFTRNVSGTLRLRDGETSLIGGLLQQSETDSFSGVFGLQSVPILNKIFTDRNKNSEESEILISITPHIVRGPKLTEEDMIPMGVGTSEVPKVVGARPSLFGPEPAPTPIPIPSGASKTSPGGGAARQTPPGPARPPSPSVGPPVAPPDAAAPVGPPVVPAVPPAASPGDAVEPSAAAALSAAAAATASSPATGAEPRPITLLFSPSELSLKVGETGVVGLVVVGARDLLSVEVLLTYDATLVELVDMGPGSLLTLDGQSVGSREDAGSGPRPCPLHADRGRHWLRRHRVGYPQGAAGGQRAARNRGFHPRAGGGDRAIDAAAVGPCGRESVRRRN